MFLPALHHRDLGGGYLRPQSETFSRSPEKPSIQGKNPWLDTPRIADNDELACLLSELKSQMSWSEI
jgi:hypothetical protein